MQTATVQDTVAAEWRRRVSQMASDSVVVTPCEPVRCVNGLTVAERSVSAKTDICLRQNRQTDNSKHGFKANRLH